MTVTASALLGPVALCVLLALSCWHDWQSRRIPNTLLLFGLAVALVWQVLAPTSSPLLAGCGAGHGRGLVASLAGAAATLLVGFALWKLKLFGAGDAKLLAVVASFTGLGQVPRLLLFTLLAGGVLALAGLVFFSLRLRFAAARQCIPSSAPAGAGTVFSAYRLPYAFAITVGSLAVVGMNYKDCWLH